MTRIRGVAFIVLLTLGCAGAFASCSARVRLERPDTIPARTIEPELVEPLPSTVPSSQPRSSGPTMPLRLLDTQARSHIGLRLLHHWAGGELTEDPVWRWSSTPDRYLDSALRLALASRPDVRRVDTGNAAAIAVTLLVWQLESAGSTQLVGVVELSVTAADRTVRTQVIRKTEPVSAELPGDLAAAAGRLLQSLASDSLSRGIQAASWE